MSTSILQFAQCSSNATCLHGGSCSDQGKCLCTPEWRNDYVSFLHQENCSLPATYLVNFFITYTVLTFVCVLVLIVIAREAKGTIKYLRNFFLVWLMFDWSVVLTVYLEDGFYTATCVINMLFIIFAMAGPVYSLFDIIRIYFELTPGIDGPRVEWRFKAVYWAWSILMTCPPFLAAAVFARSGNEPLYNACMVAWMMQFGVGLLVYIVAYMVFFIRFRNMIKAMLGKNENATDKDRDNKNREQVLDRVNTLMAILLFSTPLGFVYVGVAATLLAGYNVPFFWAFWTFLITQPVQLFGLLVKMVRDDKTRRVQNENNLVTGNSLGDTVARSNLKS
jgi:hypothetical protein